MSYLNRVFLLFCFVCLAACDPDVAIDEDTLVSQLHHIDSLYTLHQVVAPAPEVTMPMPSATEDTIIVQLELKDGWGPFESGLSLSRSFPVKRGPEYDPSTYRTQEDDPWTNTFEAVKGIPDSLENVRLIQESMQLEQAVNHAYKTGLMEEEFAMTWFREGPPTYLTEAYVDQWVSIVIGEFEDKIVLLFDTDNDENFEGETPLVLPRMPPNFTLSTSEGWQALPGARVAYEYFDGSLIREGQAFMRVNPYFNPYARYSASASPTFADRMRTRVQEALTPVSERSVMVGPSQHWEGEFAVDGQAYRIMLGNSNYGGIGPDSTIVEPVVLIPFMG